MEMPVEIRAPGEGVFESAERAEEVRRKGLLLVGNFMSLGGAQGIAQTLADQLRKARFDVITTSDKTGKLRRLADILRTAINRRRDYEVAQVDVYSGRAFVWAEAVCFTLRQLGKPFVLSLHGGNLPEFSRRFPGRVRRLLNSAMAVTAPSRYLNEQMRSYREDLILISNGIDLGMYRFRLLKRAEPQLLWLRAFHRIYNPSLGPRVLAELLGERPDALLTMVGHDKGDGSLDEARTAAARLGALPRVKFIGAVPKSEVPSWLNGADIFINTTNVDNTPVSVLEAMASGMCVVSTNVGGIPYLLDDGEDALLVPPDDPRAMADAIRRLLGDPLLCERLSRGARAKAEQFDWPVIMSQWERLFRAAPVPSRSAGRG